MDEAKLDKLIEAIERLAKAQEAANLQQICQPREIHYHQPSYPVYYPTYYPYWHGGGWVGVPTSAIGLGNVAHQIGNSAVC